MNADEMFDAATEAWADAGMLPADEVPADRWVRDSGTDAAKLVDGDKIVRATLDTLDECCRIAVTTLSGSIHVELAFPATEIGFRMMVGAVRSVSVSLASAHYAHPFEGTEQDATCSVCGWERDASWHTPQEV